MVKAQAGYSNHRANRVIRYRITADLPCLTRPAVEGAPVSAAPALTDLVWPQDQKGSIRYRHVDVRRRAEGGGRPVRRAVREPTGGLGWAGPDPSDPPGVCAPQDPPGARFPRHRSLEEGTDPLRWSRAAVPRVPRPLFRLVIAASGNDRCPLLRLPKSILVEGHNVPLRLMP